jgi:glycine cleavage system H lipoate-binding protein
MVAILVFAMFVAFILVDIVIRKRTARYVLQTAPRTETGVRKAQPVLAGYEVPEHLYFHQGHTWALSESPNMVRVGIDDFAAKLIGEAEQVNLPMRGQWIRQGQKVWSFRVNGKLVEMVSPIEGTVDGVNDTVVRHPETLTADPYGDSWLLTVMSPDAKTNFRNLLTGTMARSLIADSAKRLHNYIPAMEGRHALAQDGGKAHDGIAKHLPADKYTEITKEFFLT